MGPKKLDGRGDRSIAVVFDHIVHVMRGCDIARDQVFVIMDVFSVRVEIQ